MVVRFCEGGGASERWEIGWLGGMLELRGELDVEKVWVLLAGRRSGHVVIGR